MLIYVYKFHASTSESAVELSMYGCNMLFHPLLQNSSHYFSQLKRVYCTQTPQNIRFQVYTSHFCQISTESPFLPTDKNWKFLRFLHHTNNFKIFLPSVHTRFLRTLCTKLYQSEANFLKYVLLALLSRF